MPKLLDGAIAKAVRAGLKSAGMYKPATLVRVSAGVRAVGELAGGRASTESSQACEGFVTSNKFVKVGGTLVEQHDRVAILLGDSLGGIVPRTNDKVTIEGKTQRIVDVDRDAASATYTVLLRGA